MKTVAFVLDTRPEANPARIILDVERVISKPDVRATMTAAANSFGDDEAAERIVDSINR